HRGPDLARDRARPFRRLSSRRRAAARRSGRRLRRSPCRHPTSCPESGGKEKWRILPDGEVHDALQGGHRRHTPPSDSRRTPTVVDEAREDAALVLLFSLVASGQIKLRKIDGWQKISAVLNQHTAVAA